MDAATKNGAPDKETWDKALPMKVGWVADKGWDPDLFEVQDWYRDYVGRMVIPNGLIQARVSRLAKDIYAFYQSLQARSLTLLVIMRGAFTFARDLEVQLQKMNDRYGAGRMRIIPHFVTAKSYVGTESHIERLKFPEMDSTLIEDQHVLIVEDIYDSGSLMARLQEELQTGYKPKTLEAVVLLHKRNPKNLAKLPYPVQWFGFSIPAAFVVGYGLDINEELRSMPHVYEISEKGLAAFKEQTLA